MFVVAAVGCSSGDDAATPSSTRPPTTGATFTGDADSVFCRMFATVGEVADPFADGLPPAEIEAALAEMTTFFTDLVDVAPAEIEQDAALLAAGLQELRAGLDAVGYDVVEGVLDGRIAAGDFDLPSFDAAGERIGTYRLDVCTT